MTRPPFIVLEGPDGGGTTTHARLLCERLRREGHDVFQTAEPTRGPIGQFIREELKKGAMPPKALQMLFSADRAWHVESEIEPALQAGKTVVCERFSLSTILYGEALGLDAEWLKDMNAAFAQPDALLVLMPPYEVCLERLGGRKERDMLEGDSFQKRVHVLYERYVKTHPKAFHIDTSGAIEPVAEQIARIVETFVAPHVPVA